VVVAALVPVPAGVPVPGVPGVLPGVVLAVLPVAVVVLVGGPGRLGLAPVALVGGSARVVVVVVVVGATVVAATPLDVDGGGGALGKWGEHPASVARAAMVSEATMATTARGPVERSSDVAPKRRSPYHRAGRGWSRLAGGWPRQQRRHRPSGLAELALRLWLARLALRRARPRAGRAQ